ncbi:hypothetical protein RhiirA5_373496 [Rhizophagus irregularis]|uniref:Uncharacterized protein n=1 Tax=Rhizophagus irregularis TaxID=588596 RepID=A0A2N0PYN0_9GLOM|nr:hypothetical protein RhiirA5_373496 [Rhizophagus irregularis]
MTLCHVTLHKFPKKEILFPSKIGEMCHTKITQISIKGNLRVDHYSGQNYTTLAKAELKYVYQDLQEEKFYEEIEKNLSEHLADDDTIEVEEEFEDKDSDVSEVEDENDINNNNNGIDEYLNLASEELRQLLEVQVVEVRIEKQPVDHGEKDFDINALLQEEFDQN